VVAQRYYPLNSSMQGYSVTTYTLLLSPQTKGAFFHDNLAVAKSELELLAQQDIEPYSRGGMDFVDIECDAERIAQIRLASVVQGVFEKTSTGLEPITEECDFKLHEDFVFGSKFKGKTNELFTQFMLNVALSFRGASDGPIKLLDPMCGRATTLLWALRYGMDAKGIEQDPKALADIKQSLKKWTKLHRVKHSLVEGSARKNKKSQEGRFLEFKTSNTLKVYTGDTQQAASLLGGERFDIMVTDIPYGVQHFTTDKTRDPSAVLSPALVEWKALLKPEGVIVIGYNRNIPRRTKLEKIAVEAGFSVESFTAAHRMSESIVRDVVVLRHQK